MVVQYADDTQVLLRDWEPSTIAALLTAMSVFERASGQRLNASKTRLLLIGGSGEQLPATVGGLQCAAHADALGCTIEDVHAGQQPGSDRAVWQEMLDRVRKCFERVAARVHFSAFGRSHLAASYGVSTLLHRAEFMPVPQEHADRLSIIGGQGIHEPWSQCPRRPFPPAVGQAS